jgi:peroxiredoxin
MQPIPRRLFLVFFLLLGLGWIAISRAAPGEAAAGLVPAPQTGFPAPDFTLETIDGQTVTLSSLRGKPVILNFWASWCPPCKAEMPAIQHVYEDYRARGLVVLAVNAAHQDTLVNVQAFLTENSLTFPVPLDPAGTVNTLYQVRSLPTTFFIGADGVIREIVIGGPMTEAALRLRADSLLEDMP